MEINSIGVKRIIESAEKLGKGASKPDRQQLYLAAAAVVNECDLPEEEKKEAVRELKEALNI